MGTNTIPSATSGNVIPKEHNNAIKEALGVDFVPRDVDGIPTAVAGSLGTATFTWLRMFFGQVASGLSLRDVSGEMGFYVGTSLKALLTSTGFNTASYKDLSVTYDKLEAANLVISSGFGNYNTTSFTYTTVTNSTINLTITGGRPVMLALVSDSNTNSFIRANAGTARVAISHGGGSIGEFEIDSATDQFAPTMVIIPASALSAGLQTFQVRARVVTATSLDLNNIEFLAMEL